MSAGMPRVWMGEAFKFLSLAQERYNTYLRLLEEMKITVDPEKLHSLSWDARRALRRYELSIENARNSIGSCYAWSEAGQRCLRLDELELWESQRGMVYGQAP